MLAFLCHHFWSYKLLKAVFLANAVGYVALLISDIVNMCKQWTDIA